jgi:hypothetical protein
MESAALYNDLNKGILEERYRAFEINLEKNLELIRKYGGLRSLIPRFENKDIIIAGAGPSMANELDLIGKYRFRENIIIIAADMALMPLLKNGIVPHFTISCETTPVDYFSGLDTGKIHLLAFSCMSNTNLRKWKGPVSFYNWMIHNEKYDRLWEKAGDLGFVATGSIVTTQAISLALGCGIKSLFIIGNDMGFSTEYYTRGTHSYKKNIAGTGRLNTIETIELNAVLKRRGYEIKRGDKSFYTNNQFLAAKMWLEDLFKKVNIPIYESNDLGCSPQFVEKMSVKKYMERFERRPVKRRRK